jgi:hypothetical protein
MCFDVRLLCGALWWPVLVRCARAARSFDDDYDQVRHRRRLLCTTQYDSLLFKCSLRILATATTIRRPTARVMHST